MHAAYFVREGERNEELRFSMRSLAVNMSVESVWIIGYTPSWVTGVNSIEGNRFFPDKPKCVFDNMRILSEHPDMPDDVVVMNDDFFILEPYEPKVEYRGPLEDHVISTSRGNWWGQSLWHTWTWCTEYLGIERPLSYELHRPLPINRAKMAEALAECAEHNPLNPPQWRTVYGNRWNIGGTPAPDVKVRKSNQPIPEGPLASTDDGIFRGVSGGQIKQLFPQPGPYETYEELPWGGLTN